jgi:hypothetical protein
MASSATKALVARVVAAAPGLRSAYDEHISSNDELLPHVFFGDVTRFVAGAFATGPGGGRGGAERILQVLEEAATSGDSSVVELISVSFLENLDSRSAAYREIRTAMGPTLRRELARYEKR